MYRVVLYHEDKLIEGTPARTDSRGNPYTVHGRGSPLTGGDPVGWREGFRREGHYLRQRALDFEQEHPKAAGHSFLAAAYAYRASLQYADPTEASFLERVSEMEEAFGRGTTLLDVPLRAIEVPFEGTTLPGYYLEQDAAARPTVLMIGGGDTFREDLYYFAGYPGWKRGYH
jgi:hypothetical protein